MENKVYEIVNSKILAQLEKGVAPWRMPWKTKGIKELPQNFKTKKPYSGVNTFLLQLEKITNGFETPYWLTMNQANELGGRVRKGEKSSLVVFWKMYESKHTEKLSDGTERAKVLPVLRYYTVFNLSQIEGIQIPGMPEETEAENVFELLEQAENIIHSYPLGPVIEHGGNQAFYRPSADLVRMPEKSRFESAGEYYSTFFHELTHSTGHQRRLNREGFQENAGHVFGDANYSKEELIAEMGAAFLCGVAGIENTLPNSAAYLANWLSVLKQNKTWLVHSAAAAQRAADYIQGITQAKAKAADSLLAVA